MRGGGGENRVAGGGRLPIEGEQSPGKWIVLRRQLGILPFGAPIGGDLDSDNAVLPGPSDALELHRSELPFRLIGGAGEELLYPHAPHPLPVLRLLRPPRGHADFSVPGSPSLSKPPSVPHPSIS